jgi:gamma-glutamylcyclotransferase (GGCT)/AIG2-like uncharacterized protein YtfP
MILQQLFENSDQVIYYLAYGMLTDPDVMQGLDMVGAGVLRDYQFEFAQFANVYPEPGAQVYGTLWAIDSAVLSELDEIEGYPEFYTRDRVQVSCQGRKYTAQVYTMTAGAREDLQGSAPSSHYLARLTRGYNHAGLPQRQIQQALQALTESASAGATGAGSVAVMAQPLGELQTRTLVPKTTKYRNSVGLTTPRKNK